MKIKYELKLAVTNTSGWFVRHHRGSSLSGYIILKANEQVFLESKGSLYIYGIINKKNSLPISPISFNKTTSILSNKIAYITENKMKKFQFKAYVNNLINNDQIKDIEIKITKRCFFYTNSITLNGYANAIKGVTTTT